MCLVKGMGRLLNSSVTAVALGVFVFWGMFGSTELCTGKTTKVGGCVCSCVYCSRGLKRQQCVCWGASSSNMAQADSGTSCSVYLVQL